MSWIDKINNIKFKIITGEGSEFFPLWKNASKSRNMNPRKFQFNDTNGALVRRGNADGLVFPFEFHFTGLDNLTESDRFDVASLDKRPWTIIFPEYGEMLVHPASLNSNNKSQNVTVITGQFWETLEDSFPDASIDVTESVLSATEISVDALSNDYAENLGVPDPGTTTLLNSLITTISDKFKLAAVTDIDLTAVQNASSSALNAINNLTDDPLTFMRAAANLARTPAAFLSSVNTRLNVLQEAWDDLKLAITGIFSRQNNLFTEAMGSALITAMAESSVILTSDVADFQDSEISVVDDYETRSAVLETANFINDTVQDFLDTIGDLQSEIDATPDSYTPSQDTILYLKDVSNKATGQLLQVAVESKQERKYTVPKDTNLIILVHRLLNTYEDSEIQKFANANNFLLDEGIQIKQGREVIYFI